MERDLYCKVYLDSVSSESKLRSLIARLAGAPIEIRTARMSGLVIDIFRNDDYAPESADDFVRWPFYLEIDSDKPSTTVESFVGAIAAFLARLKEHGVRVVPASEFEAEILVAMGSGTSNQA